MKKYPLKLLAIFGFLITLLGFFNWLINPLLLFDSPAIDGVNRYKTQFFFLQHKVKPLWAQSSRPDGLILGSSRAGGGLNPDHSALPENTFNYAIPGIRINTIARVYSEARLLGDLSQVVMTLDFFSFNVSPSLTQVRDTEMFEGFYADADGDRRPFASLRRGKSLLQGLVSWQNTRNSILTMRRQSAIEERGAGFFEFTRAGNWYQTLAKGREQRQNFRVIEQNYLDEGWFPPPAREFIFANEQLSAFDSYGDLLALMYVDGVSVELVISPLHARFLSAIKVAGLWEEFEIWKRQLLAINIAMADEAGETPFPLWDFADYSELTQERIPAENDSSTRMRNYIDGQHYTVELGDRLLDRILNHQSSEHEIVEGFGSLLKAESIDIHLVRVRDLQVEYEASHGQELLDLQRSVEIVKSRNSN
ncbi:MAG: hypothetical protein JKY98_04820 [Gammaproteobacteria bacterium]|nr:hypothetical protein [Gammaproteobacteria bacterium]